MVALRKIGIAAVGVLFLSVPAEGIFLIPLVAGLMAAVGFEASTIATVVNLLFDVSEAVEGLSTLGRTAETLTNAAKNVNRVYKTVNKITNTKQHIDDAKNDAKNHKPPAPILGHRSFLTSRMVLMVRNDEHVKILTKVMAEQFEKCHEATHNFAKPYIIPGVNGQPDKLSDKYPKDGPHALLGKGEDQDAVSFVNLDPVCTVELKAFQKPVGFPGILEQGKWNRDIKGNKKKKLAEHKKNDPMDNSIIYRPDKGESENDQSLDRQAVEEGVGVSPQEDPKKAKDDPKADKNDNGKRPAKEPPAKEPPAKKKKGGKRSPKRRAPLIGESMVAALQGRYIHPTEED